MIVVRTPQVVVDPSPVHTIARGQSASSSDGYTADSREVFDHQILSADYSKSARSECCTRDLKKTNDLAWWHVEGIDGKKPTRAAGQEPAGSMTDRSDAPCFSIFPNLSQREC